VFDELDEASPRTHFSIGIEDDVSFASLPVDHSFSTAESDVVTAVFYGLGSDGTVGANKNSIKIIGDETELYAQGYFVYDSKKSGSMTVSHLRFGPRPIRSTYLVEAAQFVACHQWGLMARTDVLAHAATGATVLLNSPFGPDDIWSELPASARRHIVEKHLRVFAIDANRVAEEAGTGKRVNTVLQACFFALSGVLPRDVAVAAMKRAAKKSYGAKGAAVVAANEKAIDAGIDAMREIVVGRLDAPATSEAARPVDDSTPAFVRAVTIPMIQGHGNELPVSAMPVDGTFPVGTAKYEKRNVASDIPVWNPALCIQCNKCTFVCPHAALRAQAFDPALLGNAPHAFKSIDYRGAEFEGMKYSIQVAPEDCTGCELCVEVCPAKDRTTGVKALVLAAQAPLRDQERANFEFFLRLPDQNRSAVKPNSVKGSQFLRPLFEFSGACAGCGETPYLKLATQLFGDRMVVANATGCSSIFGGNLPTTPWTTNNEGLGPAWANSLFEDNAEFGYGMRVTIDQHAARARALVRELAPMVSEGLATAILDADQHDEAGVHEQRARVRLLKDILAHETGRAAELVELADYLVKKSVWIVGGDGWAYDIGYGGLDHVLASDKDVNILVLDTEVYSNTGGQASKSTPRGAVARFAASGKRTGKKDLALLAMTYGHVYVAHVAWGANDTQTVRAFLEAESYPGPSLIIGYAHCIAHGIDIKNGLSQQAKAVASGHWPLFRFDPRLTAADRSFPLTLDSKAPKISFGDYAYEETRYRVLKQLDPDAAKQLGEGAQHDIDARWALYESLSKR
jgi:pyruvate-ferredoxin/flavodoxin oxidoreductase